MGGVADRRTDVGQQRMLRPTLLYYFYSIGTAIGLSLQAKALAGGATSFTSLATSLFTTASGGVAAALIAIMTFNLEAGTRRAQQRLQS
jgi:hypothetical protein